MTARIFRTPKDTYLLMLTRNATKYVQGTTVFVHSPNSRAKEGRPLFGGNR